MHDGWEASLARTYVVGDPSVEQPPPAGWSELLAACRPGAPVGDLRDLDAVVYGAGRGVEPYDDDLKLQVDMVFSVELQHGHSLQQDVLRLTDSGAVSLTG